MPKTLDDLQALLTANGYACERMVDAIVTTSVATQHYMNPAGEKQLALCLTIDRANHCVVVEALHAFDLRQTAHRESTLACLMTATGQTPLVRPVLEPEGDIRLRIDCTCVTHRAREQDVLQAVTLLPSFVDAWYEQITSAMETGRFDPSRPARITISRLPTPAPPPADAAASAPAPTIESTEGRAATLESFLEATSLSLKPGGQPNRLRTLFAFQKWLAEHRPRRGDRN